MLRRIDPIQPYFVLNTGSYYKLFSSAPQIAHFYQFTYTEDNPVMNGAVPDGAIDMIFDISVCSACIVGSSVCVTETVFEPGHSYFGARFEPGVFCRIGKLSAAELVGESVPLGEVFKMDEMERIFSDISIEERADIVCGSLSQSREIPALAGDILSVISEKKGDVTVSELEQELYYSRKHLTRVFSQYTGMDIKSYCRIVRFQSALHAIKEKREKYLTNVAMDHGYYDQSHFLKEFKQFSTLTPKAFAELLERTSYGSRIKTC